MGWAAKILRFIWQNKGWIVPVVAEAYNVFSKWIRSRNDDPAADNDDTQSSDVNSKHDDNTAGNEHSGTANGQPDKNKLGYQNPVAGVTDTIKPRNEINTVIFPI